MLSKMEIRNKSTFCDKSKEKIFFRGSGMKILQKITKEYPNYYYLNEIVGEMINKTGKEVSIPTVLYGDL
ncbi:unnamed protein product [Rhizophagus irregularis]|nr:unnamed protein product [Rhizophagus irregularis]